MADDLTGYSTRAIFVGIGLLTTLVGVDYWFGQNPTDIIQSILFLMTGLIIGFEYGWKKLSNISFERAEFVDWIISVWIMVLLSLGIVGLSGWSVPDILSESAGFILVVSGGWMVFEGFF